MEADAAERAKRAVFLYEIFKGNLCRRLRRRHKRSDRVDERLRRHASPRKMVAGRTLARRRNGYEPRMATMTVSATEIGYTMRRGAAATPKTALPSAMESAIPA